MALNCSDNPLQHFFRSSKRVPECKSPPLDPARDSIYPSATFIIALPVHVARARKAEAFLEGLGFPHVQVWPAVNGTLAFKVSEYKFSEQRDPKTGKITRAPVSWFDSERKVTTHPKANDGYLGLGERGYRETMRNIFTHAASLQDLRTILVLDYDVVFHCSFMRRFTELMTCPRCARPVAASNDYGGALMLGATLWHPKSTRTSTARYFGGWDSADEDMEQRAREYPKSQMLCFNYAPCIVGSFAVIYHRRTFQHVLNFLALPLKLPFDHVFHHLLVRDIPVRVASPFLCAADVSHESSVDPGHSTNVALRLSRHRWDPKAFCQTNSTQLFFQAGSGAP